MLRPWHRTCVLALLAAVSLVACDDAGGGGDESGIDTATTTNDTSLPDQELVDADAMTADTSDTAEALDTELVQDAPTDQVDADPDQSCTPDCSGRACGDDGCGGSCGSCEASQSCEAGICVAADCPAGCTSDCAQGCFDLGGCVSGDTVDTWPSVRTAGLLLGASAAPGAGVAQVYYRASGATTWWRGHDTAALPDGRHGSSLFWLAPQTDYEVMMRAGDGTVLGCGALRTLAVDPEHETVQTLYVDATAAAGGDGSPGAPLQTVQGAVDLAAPGTDIVVRPGIYRESVSMAGVHGEPGRYVRLLGEPGAVLDGSDVDATAPTWEADGSAVWRTPWAGAPGYLSRDGQRQYHYTSLQGLRDGIGDDGEAIAEGWFVDGGQLYVRSLTDPATHTWQLPSLQVGVGLDGASWIWIEGLEVRFYGEGDYAKGIDVRDSSQVVIRGNHIHETPWPVWVRRASSHVRIEGNHIHQANVFDWPWAAVKGTDHENSAITLGGGESLLAAHNTIHDIFNGIASGSFADAQNPALALDVDVYGNRMTRIGDDGLEPEGACINNRFWGNAVDRTHSGVSLAPITFGPVWVLRNRFTDYRATGFKVSNDSSARVWLYHNTSWVDAVDHNGMNVSGMFDAMVFRNNIVRGTRYAVEMSLVAGADNDLDYDNLYTPRGAPVIKYDNVRYDSLTELCAATGHECHGQPEAPMLLDPLAGAFGLQSSSANVDAGLAIYGINDGFEGAGPDIGYVELGGVEPTVLP